MAEFADAVAKAKDELTRLTDQTAAEHNALDAAALSKLAAWRDTLREAISLLHNAGAPLTPILTRGSQVGDKGTWRVAGFAYLLRSWSEPDSYGSVLGKGLVISDNPYITGGIPYKTEGPQGYVGAGLELGMSFLEDSNYEYNLTRWQNLIGDEVTLANDVARVILELGAPTQQTVQGQSAHVVDDYARRDQAFRDNLSRRGADELAQLQIAELRRRAGAAIAVRDTLQEMMPTLKFVRTSEGVQATSPQTGRTLEVSYGMQDFVERTYRWQVWLHTPRTHTPKTYADSTWDNNINTFISNWLYATDHGGTHQTLPPAPSRRWSGSLVTTSVVNGAKELVRLLFEFATSEIERHNREITSGLRSL